MLRVITTLLVSAVLAGCSLIVEFKDPPAGTCGDGGRQLVGSPADARAGRLVVR